MVDQDDQEAFSSYWPLFAWVQEVDFKKYVKWENAHSTEKLDLHDRLSIVFKNKSLLTCCILLTIYIYFLLDNLYNLHSKMTSPMVPIAVVSAFWAVFGLLLPCFAQGENKQVVRVSLVLTAICCWLFWFCTYLHQLNPLIGPELKAGEAIAVFKQWAGRTE